MKPPRFLSPLMLLACLVAATAIFIRARELGSLHAEQQRLPAQSEDVSSDQATPPPASFEPQSPSAELLQLRNQVSQLTDRRRELANVTVDNEQLHVQLARKSATDANGVPLPPDYIRTSTAKWQGLNTPENVVQSFLSAIRTQNITNLLQVLTPQTGEMLMKSAGGSPEKFFEHAATLPGMRIVHQEQMPDGSVQLDVEIMPGTREPEPMVLRRFPGEWRLEMMH
jgi:hypothetical protein